MLIVIALAALWYILTGVTVAFILRDIEPRIPLLDLVVCPLLWAIIFPLCGAIVIVCGICASKGGKNERL